MAAQITVAVSVQLAVGVTGHPASTNQPFDVGYELLITGLTVPVVVVMPPPVSGLPPLHSTSALPQGADGGSVLVA